MFHGPPGTLIRSAVFAQLRRTDPRDRQTDRQTDWRTDTGHIANNSLHLMQSMQPKNSHQGCLYVQGDYIISFLPVFKL